MDLVFDTNVYLAAMSGNTGFCYKLLKRVLEDRQENFLYVSQAILSEIHSAGNRLLSKEIIDRSTFALILSLIQNAAFRVQPKEKIHGVVRHEKDHIILECALAAKAHLIITMDKDLLKLKKFRNVGIVHPKTLFYMFPKN